MLDLVSWLSGLGYRGLVSYDHWLERSDVADLEPSCLAEDHVVEDRVHLVEDEA